MAAITKNRNFFKRSKLLYFKSFDLLIEFLIGYLQLSVFEQCLLRFASPKTWIPGDFIHLVDMVLGWPPFKFVSDSHAIHPRWPPLLKIEISSNGQNCSILSQNVPKLNCISIMMSFLTYITGFFMNFELLHTI
jgi:hypothetical protein